MRFFPILLACALALCATAPLTAQHCGVLPEGDDLWAKHYCVHKHQFPVDPDSLLHAPMAIWMVADDDGIAALPWSGLLDAYCSLQSYYDSANVRFFMIGLDSFNNSALYVHGNDPQDYLDVANITAPYDSSGAVNCYMVADPAGACGYYLRRPDNIFINYGCMEGETWAHECGHLFTLPHPFFGWEDINYTYSQPTPQYHYSDWWVWQDTVINGDTVFTNIQQYFDTLAVEVELVDGSNCATAADRVCDTGPDYLSDRWTCNANAQSPTLQKDPDNVDFRSDGRNIMSYSDDACMDGFTPGQIEQMRANIVYQRGPGFAQYPYPGYQPITAVPTQLVPAEGTVLAPGQYTFTWDAVPNATAYVLEVGLSSSPNSISTVYEEVMVRDTFYASQRFFNPLPMNNNYRYFWRVRPFNPEYTCTSFTPITRFGASNAVSVNALPGTAGEVRVFPSPLSAGEPLQVQFDAAASGSMAFALRNMAGQVVRSGIWEVQAGENRFSIVTDALPAGTYALRLSSAGGLFDALLVIPR